MSSSTSPLRGCWSAMSLSWEVESGGRAEARQSSRSVGSNTDCTGGEPCYSVPVLQNVLTAAPGVTSRLYSVQVLSQTELDTMAYKTTKLILLDSLLQENCDVIRTSIKI